MQKEDSVKTSKPSKQRHFVARELQFSIALLIVLALLGGIFLQTISSALIDFYGIKTPVLGVFLVLGYVLLVVLLAIFFTHRLIGPFKRLEYEMKIISSGELGKRLSIRTQDDLHIRNFIKYTNDFISSFYDMSREYNLLSATLDKKLDELIGQLSAGNPDCSRLREELMDLRKKVHELRERW